MNVIPGTSYSIGLEPGNTGDATCFSSDLGTESGLEVAAGEVMFHSP